MHEARVFVESLAAEGVRFWTGVPDSLMAPLSAHLARHAGPTEHVIAVNEGAAVAIAAGHHLATGATAAVYLQNSGLGNAVNPILSLVRPFEIPMLLIIGWRGEPGVPDEPQHTVQGATMTATLDALEISHVTLDRDPERGRHQAVSLLGEAKRTGRPCALIVRRDTFRPTDPIASAHPDRPLTREQAIRTIMAVAEPESLIVATTGKASRELFTLREEAGSGHDKDLLIVGSMGHAAHVALGISVAQPERPIWLLDGDGALLMHQGALALIGARHARVRHVVLNNGAHESVGGQPTPVGHLDLEAIASASGYRWVGTADDEQSFNRALSAMGAAPSTSFLDVRIRTGSRPDLGRPTRSPAQNAAEVMTFLEQ